MTDPTAPQRQRAPGWRLQPLLNCLDARWRQLRWVLVMLIVVTLVAAHPAVRFEVLGDYFPVGPKGGEMGAAALRGDVQWTPRDIGIALRAPDAAAVRAVEWTVSRPAAATAVRVLGEVELLGVASGAMTRDTAQVAVRQLQGGTRLSVTGVMSTVGSRSVVLDEVVGLRTHADELVLIARLVRVKGELHVAKLGIQWLEERAGFGGLLPALVTLLGGALALVAASWTARGRYRLVLLLVFGAVLYGVLMPGDTKSSLEQWVLDVFAWRPEESIGLSWSDLTHFGMFLALGLTLAFARPDLAVGVVLADMGLLAAATETLQLMVEGRQASIADASLDLAGALVGISLIRLLARSTARPDAALK